MYNFITLLFNEFYRIYLLLTFQMCFIRNTFVYMFAYINEFLDKSTEVI